MIAKSEIEKLSKKNRLGNIVEFLDHLRKPVRSDQRKAGQYPYYGANGQQGTIDDYLFDEPLILLAEDGGNFDDPDRSIAYKVEGKCWVNNHAHVLRVKNGNYIDYVLYHLAFYDVRPYINGATRSKLNKSQAEKIILYTPDYEDQKRIAIILNQANSIHQKRRETLRLADEFLRSTFLEMFGDPVLNKMKWEVKKLKRLTTKIGSGATPRGGKSAYKSKGISLIRSLNVYDAHFKYDNLAFIDNNQASKLDNVKVENDDVLLNITGASVCRCTIVPKDILPARVNQHVSIIRTKESLLNPQYLNYFLISPNYKSLLLNIALEGGATRQAITKEQIENLDISLPPIHLQNKFSEIVEKTEQLKRKYEDSLQESENLFNSLMQRAFRGEL